MKSEVARIKPPVASKPHDRPTEVWTIITSRRSGGWKATVTNGVKTFETTHRESRLKMLAEASDLIERHESGDALSGVLPTPPNTR